MITQPMTEVAAAYDRWAMIYETNANATRDLAARTLREHFLDRAEVDVLEIGCGTGLNTRHLATVSRSVLAVDISEGMLAQARTNVPAHNVRFRQWDIEKPWDLPDAGVDRIVCTLVLEHIRDLRPIFQEAARTLRPGGTFFLCELHPFRQRIGSQAQFIDETSGDTVLVSAFLHDVSEYVNTGIECGLVLAHLGEWNDDGVSVSTPPRLLSVLFRRPIDAR